MKTSKGPLLVAELETKLIEYYGKEEEYTEGFPGFNQVGACYGPREGCIAGAFENDDVLQGVLDMVYTYCAVIRDRVQEELGIATGGDEHLSIVVEPSYEDRAVALVYLNKARIIVFEMARKPWHLTWKVVDEMADDMNDDYELMLKATKKALGVEA